MKIEDLKTRVNELIDLADKTLRGSHETSFGYSVSTETFQEFRVASLSFLGRVFTIEHPFYTDFDKQVIKATPGYTSKGRGILLAAKNEIENGGLFTIKGLVSAEIFSDFLEMAAHLLEEGYKDPAAVMTGSVLEEHLRHLCQLNNIPIENFRDGKPLPKKADLLNSELSSSKVYNKLDQKNVTAWLDLRNKAAHGQYSEYTKDQVDLMYQGVTNFVSRTT